MGQIRPIILVMSTEEENIYTEFWLEILSKRRILKHKDGAARIILKYILIY
jgi:hypothetical protein